MFGGAAGERPGATCPAACRTAAAAIAAAKVHFMFAV
jgi:hypothetical protein